MFYCGGQDRVFLCVCMCGWGEEQDQTLQMCVMWFRWGWGEGLLKWWDSGICAQTVNSSSVLAFSLFVKHPSFMFLSNSCDEIVAKCCDVTIVMKITTLSCFVSRTFLIQLFLLCQGVPGGNSHAPFATENARPRWIYKNIERWGSQICLPIALARMWANLSEIVLACCEWSVIRREL